MSSVLQPRVRVLGRVMSVAAVAVLSVVLGCGLGWLLFEPNSPLNKRGALACACEWARLSPPPASIDINVKTKGSLFTREFVITFSGSPEGVLAWLQACPGPSQALAGAERLLDGHFDILPGGGAVFAEMTVSGGGTKVVIRTYWS